MFSCVCVCPSQGRSPVFEVRGPSLRCALAPPGEDPPKESFLGPSPVASLSPPRIRVGFMSYSRSVKDFVSVARVGGVPLDAELSR